MSHPMGRVEGTPDHAFIRGLSNPAIVSARGTPTVPSDVQKQLDRYNREKGGRYRIEWQPSAWGTSYFGLFEQWAERDPRREDIQRGSRDPGTDRDLVTTFPPEVRPAEMLAWMEAHFGRLSDDPAGDAQRIVDRRMKQNGELVEGHVDEMIQTGEDRFVRESDHVRRVRGGFEKAHPMVTVTREITPEITPDVAPKRLIEVIPK